MARLIDTSVVIAMERRGQLVADITAVAAGEPGALASITAAELLVGVERAIPAERRRRRERFVEEVLARVPVLPFDLRLARVHARVSAILLDEGRQIGDHDRLIAATVLAYGYDLLTLNRREFDRVPGLVVRLPDW